MTNELYLKRDDVLNLFEEYQPRLATHVSEFGDALEDLKFRTLELQPCEDCISREEAINELKLAYFNKDLQSAKDDPCIVDAMTDWAIRTIKNLPSVTPQTKVGYWVEMELVDTGVSKFSCSVCKEGDFYNQIDNPFIPTKYCPNCGADMRGDEDV